MTLRLISLVPALMMAVACASSATSAKSEPDPRQGEEARQICFTSQIRNWRENDHSSIIVELRRDEEYKLVLAGACRPNDAFISIGLVSRVGGGNCLSAGDRLVTDSRFSDGSCSITRIYHWNKDAGKATQSEAAATSADQK